METSAAAAKVTPNAAPVWSRASSEATYSEKETACSGAGGDVKVGEGAGPRERGEAKGEERGEARGEGKGGEGGASGSWRAGSGNGSRGEEGGRGRLSEEVCGRAVRSGSDAAFTKGLSRSPEWCGASSDIARLPALTSR